jgi:hypothetical protein
MALSTNDYLSTRPGQRLVISIVVLVVLCAIAFFVHYKRRRAAAAAPPCPDASSSDERDIEMNKEAPISNEPTDVDSESAAKDDR